jgi:hypothetical protein
MGDVVSEFPNGFEPFEQASEGSSLLRRVLFIFQILRESANAILEVPIFHASELIGIEVILQEYEHQIVQGAKIQEKIADSGRPIQTGGDYGDGIYSRRCESKQQFTIPMNMPNHCVEAIHPPLKWADKNWDASGMSWRDQFGYP